MAAAIFLIPQRDAERVHAVEGHLRDVFGLTRVDVRHEPFDPFGPDAETRAVDEARVRVSFNPSEITLDQVKKAFTAAGIHILDTRIMR